MDWSKSLPVPCRHLDLLLLEDAVQTYVIVSVIIVFPVCENGIGVTGLDSWIRSRAAIRIIIVNCS